MLQLQVIMNCIDNGDVSGPGASASFSDHSSVIVSSCRQLRENGMVYLTVPEDSASDSGSSTESTNNGVVNHSEMDNNHVDLDEEMHLTHNELKKYLDDGSKSLVFNSPIIKEIQRASSFDAFFPKLTTKTLTDDGRVRKVVLRKGNGVAPKKGAQIWVHYVIFNEKDSPERRPFDSTRERQRLETLKLNGEKLPCMNIALESMEYEEVALFISTSDYAYGQLGCPPRIQPDTRILFIVELTDLIESTDTPLSLKTTNGHTSLEFRSLLDEAQCLHEQGNWHFNSSAAKDGQVL